MDTMDGDVQRIARQRAWSEAEGKRMVDAWRRSGESRAAFACRYGIAVHRRYSRSTTTADARRPVPERGPVQFHPVRVLPDRAEPGGAAPIEIRVIRVPRGVATEELRTVLAALDHHG